MVAPSTIRPPRAAGLLLLGSALSIASDPLGFLTEQHRRLGPTFRVVPAT
jgi:hypothetical protein